MRTDRPRLTPSRFVKARPLFNLSHVPRVVLLTLLLCASTLTPTARASSPQTEPAWRWVTTEDGKLSAMMPAPPKELVRDEELFYGGRVVVVRTESRAAYSNEAVFLVLRYKASEPERLRVHIVDRMKLNSSRDAWLTVGAVTLGGAAGTRVVYQDASHYRVRYFFPGKDALYEVSAGARGRSNRGLQTFLSSVRFGKGESAGLTAPAVAEPEPAAPPPDPSGPATHKAAIIFKPEPRFPKKAAKNLMGGVVKLRLLLASSGQVSNITVQDWQPDGLTEAAVEAAEHIAFLPAVKDGRLVSQWIVVEYAFNIN